jgi:hypothetical protein
MSSFSFLTLNRPTTTTTTTVSSSSHPTKKQDLIYYYPPWSNIVPELLVRICEYLFETELMKLSCVCKNWREIADSDKIWINRTATRWANKWGVTIGHLYKLLNVKEDVLSTFTVKDFKNLLSDRGIDTKAFIEKQDFCVAFKLSQATILSQPSYPKYPPIGGKWKASFIYAEICKSKLTVEELCNADWYFMFKQHDGFESKAKFHPDGRFTMHPWPMPDPGSLRWRLLGGGGGNNDTSETSAVQIHHFPAHRLYRLRDWSWMMQNGYVAFFMVTPNLQAHLTEFRNGLSAAADDDEDDGE